MAKKKNAPVLKNNLRNAPAEKFRAVNRMNEIVTMVEYTSEDDIKAYELEPTYRELGGGGGSAIPMMTLTVIAPEGTTEEKTYGWVCFNNNMLQMPIFTEGENIIKMLYMQMDGEVYPYTYRNIGTHTFSNLVNCIIDEDAILITDPAIDSSATLTITSW